MGKRIETASIRLANWILKHGTSESYQRNLDKILKLGMLKAREVILEREALDRRLANEPGADPVTGEIIHPEPLQP